MAGIGFELKKLYSKRGLFASLKAITYSTAVCTGPMILGTILLLGIMLLCSFFSRSSFDRELLVCMTTYSLLGSLLVTSYFSMVVTRFLADMLYSNHEETILPSFYGVNTITLIIGGALYAIFLFFSGSTFTECVFVWIFFMELIVTWNAQSYMTAVKEYRGILISYIVAIGVSLLTTFVLFYFGAPTVVGALVALCLGYGCMLLYDFVMLVKFFPDSKVSPFMFLRWCDSFGKLCWIGFFMTLGLFTHLLIIWVSPLKVVVKGLWIGAPYHDVPALLAFLTILVTTVSFVVSVEVNFYPKYRDYYALYNDKGTIKDILRIEKEMIEVLKTEIYYTGLKQLFVSAAAISLSGVIFNYLPLGFNELMQGYFRTLCVGYGIYAVANTMLMILLYFTDYQGALIASGTFAIATSVFTAIFCYFDVVYYGFGFLIGCALFFVVCAVRLDKYTRRLPYYALSIQPLVSEAKGGLFTRLGLWLEKGRENS